MRKTAYAMFLILSSIGSDFTSAASTAGSLAITDVTLMGRARHRVPT
jgi:hypothetical protein